MSINFEFLNDITDVDYLNICERLYSKCTNVEEFVYAKPPVALVECRIAGEMIAQLYYAKQVGNFEGLTFDNLLKDGQFREALAKLPGKKGFKIREDFYQIKYYGNRAAHGKFVPNAVTQALTNLKNLHGIVTALLIDLKLLDPMLVKDYTEPCLLFTQPPVYTIQTPVQISVSPSEPETDLSSEKITPSKGAHEETADGVLSYEKPAVVHAANLSCFDSNMSRLHYFVARRNDCYATNALEYLDYNEFLYALLKDQGYQRVIIVGTLSEGGGTYYPVMTWDRLSQLSFLNPVKFESFFQTHHEQNREAFVCFCEETPGPLQLGVEQFPIGVNQPEVLPFGKRVIGKIATATEECPSAQELFEGFISTQVSAALQSDRLKTAIVMPLELLMEPGRLSSMVVRRLSACIGKQGNSILVVTAEQEKDLYQMFDSRVLEAYRKLDNAVDKTISAFQTPRETAVYGDRLVEELSADGRILITADTPGQDEIANLLLALKVEQPERFDRLAYSKIYSLAEFISTKCGSSSDTQKALSGLKKNTWYVGQLRSLVLALRDDSVLDALVAVSDSLWSRAINHAADLQPTYLERVYASANLSSRQSSQAPMCRSHISDAEQQSKASAVQMAFLELPGLSCAEDLNRKVLARVSAVKQLRDENGPGHYIFAGNPGTGKAAAAKLMGMLLHSKGLLAKGHIVRTSGQALAAEDAGALGYKTRKKCEEALDGVLYVEDAYRLVDTGADMAGRFPSAYEEAYAALTAFMEHNRRRLCVICGGRPYEMEKFRTAYPRMSQAIPESNVIDFPDYSADVLYEIMLVMARKGGLALADDFHIAAQEALHQMKEKRDKDFRNADDVDRFLITCRDNALLRNSETPFQMLELTAEDIPSEFRQTINTRELNGLIGRERVKEELLKLIIGRDFAKGAKRTPGNYIFMGNPGTGKGFTAQIFGKVLKDCGFLRLGHTVELSPEKLTSDSGELPSATAKKRCAEAENGVLLVRQAGQLAGIGALDAVTASMENSAQRLCVIFAGSEEEMNRLKEEYPKLRRHIAGTVSFEDYTDEELLQILKASADFKTELSDEFVQQTGKVLPVMRRAKDFRGAESIIRYLERCIVEARSKKIGADRAKTAGRIVLRPEDIPDEYTDESLSAVGTDYEQLERLMKEVKFTLLPRSVIADLPNPYQGVIDIESPDFPTHCARSIMRIETEFGSATAFLISPDGYAITCAHGVAQKGNFMNLARKRLHAYYKNSADALEFKIVNTRPDLDMALIKVNMDAPRPYLYLDEDRDVKFGEHIYLYGYPDGRSGIMQFEGTVSSEAEPDVNGGLGNIYNVSSNAEPGDSGGPIIAKADGCVIGILRGANGKYNYMKPTLYFWKEFLK